MIDSFSKNTHVIAPLAFTVKDNKEQLLPTTNLNLENIQGNSLGGFNKDFQANIFLKFKGADAGRAWVKEVCGEVAQSNSTNVIQFNNQFSKLRRQGIQPEKLISAVWVNLVFSFHGFTALALKASDLDQFPDVFRYGMAAAQARIDDVGKSDPSNWIKPFDTPTDIHAMLIVAADRAPDLQEKIDSITSTLAFQAGVEILLNQAGSTRCDLPGHEHFGFKDGISQPGVRGVDPPDDPIGNPDQGHPGQDLLWPGEFILGYATQIDTADSSHNPPKNPNPNPGLDSQSGPAWTKGGSYLVFRRLRQDVAGFQANVEALATKLGLSIDLTGAKLVGRYKSGAPLEKREFQPGFTVPPSTDPGDKILGNPALANNIILNNNFEFDDDPSGAICPLAAHIRKVYPRNEVTEAEGNSESETQTHRLLRRGIPYGPPFEFNVPGSNEIDRGLLFACYQSDITEQFEYVQHHLANEPSFPPVTGSTGVRIVPGQDPIIAQSESGDMLVDPGKPSVAIKHFVTTTGGEYFFSPSIDTIKGIGGGTI